MEYRVGLDHGRRFHYCAHGQGGRGKVRRREKRPDLFSPPLLCRSHKQRSKSGLTLEIDDPVRKPFGIVRRKPLSVELDTSLDVPALNGLNGHHLNFLTIDV